jgi:septum site-determining protein MinD
MTKFLAVASGKSGVGRTTVALNLGTALSVLGKEVIVMDLDVHKPAIHSHLGASHVPITVHDALDGRHHVRSAIYKHPSGLKVISGSPGRHPSKVSLDRLPDVLLDLVGASELVIMDVGSGHTDEAESVMRAAHEVLLITQPDMASVTDALRTLRSTQDMRCMVIGVVANRVGRRRGEMPLERIEQVLDHPVIAAIPEDAAIGKAMGMQHPVVYTHPRCRASREFRRLALNVFGEQFDGGVSDESPLHRVLHFVGLE